MLVDQGTMRLCGVYHRHRSNKKCDGFTKQGPSEIRNLLEKFVEPEVKVDGLWEEKPHVTADNYFTDDHLLNWMGVNKYGYCATTARNKLPSDINDKYLHKEHVQGKKNAKAARFLSQLYLCVRKV